MLERYISESLPVKSSSKCIVETLVNAQSVEAGGYIDNIRLNNTTESELWIFVNIDQQPWALQGSYVTAGGFNPSGNDHNVLFPVRKDVETVYSTIYAPCVSLFIGSRIHASLGLTEPTTISEAKEYISYPLGHYVRIENKSENTATVTIRVMRIWR